MPGNWHLPCENKLVYNKIIERLENIEHGVFISDEYYEFGGVTYLVQSSKDTPQQLHLSISLGIDAVAKEALQQAHTSLEPIAVAVPTQQGYDLTLKVDLASLQQLPEQEQTYWAKSLASIRLLVAGYPLRECFRSLAAGGSAGHVETQLLQLSPKHHMVLAQRADSATLVFPLHFEAPQDAAIACAFLQQFPEARRSTGGAAAPSCSYMSARAPPLEVRQCRQAAGLLASSPPGWPSAGYIILTLFNRHVSGSQLEQVVWGLLSFPELVRYHVSNCKAWMHSEMRGKVAGMLHSLEGDIPRGQGARRTASGRYMQQHSQAAVQAAPRASHASFRRRSAEEQRDC